MISMLGLRVNLMDLLGVSIDVSNVDKKINLHFNLNSFILVFYDKKRIKKKFLTCQNTRTRYVLTRLSGGPVLSP